MIPNNVYNIRCQIIDKVVRLKAKSVHQVAITDEFRNEVRDEVDSLIMKQKVNDSPFNVVKILQKKYHR